MKILHIAESIQGGCGTYLNEIVPLQILQWGEDQIRCLVPAQHVAQLADVPSAVVRTFDRPSRRAGLGALLLAVRSAVREWRPDLLHLHSSVAGAVVRALAWLQPLPSIVYCPHGWAFDAVQGRAARAAVQAAERLLARRAQRIVAISEFERDAGIAAGIPAGRFCLVYNGISVAHEPRHAAWDDARLKVLFVGRLDRQKGVDILLDAVRGLDERIAVRIVGQAVVAAGDPAGHRRLAHVDFLGWQDKAAVAAQINACDVVVMPSRWEGFGLVAVEAMRAGKPVLASAVGGLPEVVVDGQTGRLVTPGDAGALAAALRDLGDLYRTDRAALQRMGEAGRQRFLARFSSRQTHERLAQLYAELRQPAAAAAGGPGLRVRPGAATPTSGAEHAG